MEVREIVLTGSWIDVIGLVISAVGATKLIEEATVFNRNLVVIGEGLQAIGDSLLAIGATEPLVETGAWIQAAGAATTSFGVSIQQGPTLEEGIRFEVLGDSLQSLGAALSLPLEEKEILVMASKLESLGAAIEAMGVLFRLRGQEKKGTIINAFGSWIQALGGTIAAIVITLEEHPTA